MSGSKVSLSKLSLSTQKPEDDGWIQIYKDRNCRRFYKVTRRVGSVVFYDLGEIIFNEILGREMPFSVVGHGNYHVNDGIKVVPYTKELREYAERTRGRGFLYPLPQSNIDQLPSTRFYRKRNKTKI